MVADLAAQQVAHGFPVVGTEAADALRAAADTYNHPVGTCKMGRDPMAVVDERLRVRGVEGLRVADASVMPTIVNANTHIPSVVIGEKAADLVLGRC